MLRAIDTQTIYQQTPEISNRQQVHNQGEHTQQDQFAHIMQKQTEVKKESVNHLEKDEKIRNDLKKENNERQKQEQKKQKKNSSETKQNPEQRNKETRIDIRI